MALHPLKYIFIHVWNLSLLERHKKLMTPCNIQCFDAVLTTFFLVRVEISVQRYGGSSDQPKI